jgi:hypothetical protein
MRFAYSLNTGSHKLSINLALVAIRHGTYDTVPRPNGSPGSDA